MIAAPTFAPVMDLTYEANYQQLEERYRWFASRRDAVCDLLAGAPHQFAGPLNQLLLSWVRAENAVLRHVNLPVGVSVLALAQKPA